MPTDTAKPLRYPGSDLVFGLVAPVGADLEALEADLSHQVRRYGYTPNSIRLSEILSRDARHHLDVELRDAPEFDRLMSYMDGGNELRQRFGSGEILALWAMAYIKNSLGQRYSARRRTAHILRSIKHPDEARALRDAYGPGFFLIGLSASAAQKRWFLRQKGLAEEQAQIVIERDVNDATTFGQGTRNTVELVDVYIRQRSERTETAEQLKRFLRLVFGGVADAPTEDERAMSLAYASVPRSDNLSRGAGAAMWKPGVGPIATGCDYTPPPVDLNGIDPASESTLFSVLETFAFARPVHAEMNALLGCAREGINTNGATLFSTGFPCPHCARHLVAAGTRRVVYIDPCEKSPIWRYCDAITAHERGDHDDAGRNTTQIVFEPFVGVGPSRYVDLFH